MTSTHNNFDIIGLVAGKGTRLKSDLDLPKCLHSIRNQPMTEYIVKLAEDLKINPLLVIGFQGEKIQQLYHQRSRFVWQHQQLGTGHAVKVCLPHIHPNARDIVVLPGDHSFIFKPQHIQDMVDFHRQQGNQVTLLAFKVTNPFGYGRVVMSASGQVEAIVEQLDLTPEQESISLINHSTYVIQTSVIQQLINQIKPNPKKGEYYLTDIVAIAKSLGYRVGAYSNSDINFRDGVNTLDQLKAAQL